MDAALCSRNGLGRGRRAVLFMFGARGQDFGAALAGSEAVLLQLLQQLWPRLCSGWVIERSNRRKLVGQCPKTCNVHWCYSVFLLLLSLHSVLSHPSHYGSNIHIRHT